MDTGGVDQQQLAFREGGDAQQAMAESYALEYPLNPEATLNPDVKPFDELEPPQVDVSSLNGRQVTDLMTEAGLL